MIKINKCINAPSSLSLTIAYNGEDVIKQLIEDHYSKCYICEMKRCTDFEVEHLKCQKNHPMLRQNWTNLFLSCKYCNGKKSNNFDDILNPNNNNIEEDVKQSIDFINNAAIFTPNGNNQAQENTTVELLNRIYNGTAKFRKIKEENFFNYSVGVINNFQNLTKEYLLNYTLDVEVAICEELNINEEMLGFKYWIIKNNSILNAKFANRIVWNK